MEFKIRFRFNKLTGEVELFEVDDVGPMRLPEAEHNRHHDQVAAQVGTVVERSPRVSEVLPGAPTLRPSTPKAEPEAEAEAERTRQEQAE